MQFPNYEVGLGIIHHGMIRNPGSRRVLLEIFDLAAIHSAMARSKRLSRPAAPPG